VSGVGRWLVVSDPLERANAVVVMGGHVPFRAMEAAEIYRVGWALEVWLSRQSSPAAEAALARLGLDLSVGDNAINRAVLERLGVPAGAIRVLSPGVRNTTEELVAREMARVAAERVSSSGSRPSRSPRTWGRFRS
jgi:hypothetical protein